MKAASELEMGYGLETKERSDLEVGYVLAAYLVIVIAPWLHPKREGL